MEAVQLFGGNGYTAPHRVEQLSRDAVSLLIHAGPDEVQVTHVAKGLLRRGADPGYGAVMSEDTRTDDTQGFIELVGAGTPTSDDGSARLEIEVDEKHLNPAGTVHGGLLATLVDTTMGAAVKSAMDGETPATSQLSVTYLRPGKPGRLTVTAEVRKRGDSITVCEADVQQDGKSLVHALATFAIIKS